MKNKTVLNYALDAVLLAGFLVAFFLDLTGVEGHQWLGVAVAAFSVYHLILHWNWVKGVTQKLFGQVSTQARAYYLLDAILLVGLGLISLTGLVISTWLGFELADYAVWLDFHIIISIATLLALVVKIALHWKWIVATSRRIFGRRESITPAGRVLQPALARAEVSRREFLSLMGVVGAASALAAANGMSGLTSAQAGAPIEQKLAGAAQTANSVSSSPSSASSGNATTSACRVRCNKRCSYPGHCRRYVDSNANKKCDLGECL